MPYLSIQTNKSLRDEEQTTLLDAASRIVASELHKPEAYVMTSLLPAVRMTFGGQDDPAAFIEVRSIGIPDSSRNSLTAALTDLVARSCEIKTDRIYVVLADIPGQFWALKGMTLR